MDLHLDLDLGTATDLAPVHIHHILVNTPVATGETILAQATTTTAKATSTSLTQTPLLEEWEAVEEEDQEQEQEEAAEEEVTAAAAAPP